MRPLLAAVAAAAAASLGALILGEYPFSGAVPLVAGVLFGLATAEVHLVVGKSRSWGAATTAAVLAGAGLLWAGWISDGPAGPFIPTPAFLAAALGVAAALAWLRTGRAAVADSASDEQSPEMPSEND